MAFAPILAFASAVVTGVVLMVATGAAPDDLARYVWPLLAGVLVAMLVMLVDGAALPFRSRRDGGAALAAVAIGSALAILAPLPRELDIGFTGIANIWNGYDPLQATARYRYEYGVAQASMPKGEAAVTTDYPFLFDYKRNDVVNLDVPGLFPLIRASRSHGGGYDAVLARSGGPVCNQHCSQDFNLPLQPESLEIQCGPSQAGEEHGTVLLRLVQMGQTASAAGTTEQYPLCIALGVRPARKPLTSGLPVLPRCGGNRLRPASPTLRRH